MNEILPQVPLIITMTTLSTLSYFLGCHRAKRKAISRVIQNVRLRRIIAEKMGPVFFGSRKEWEQALAFDRDIDEALGVLFNLK